MNKFTPLARRSGEPADDWEGRLIDDLTARHQHGCRVPVETYLERLPGLADEAEIVHNLLAAEWTLRRQEGEAINLNEYVRRFPAWEQDLRLLWEADRQTPTPEAALVAAVPGLTPFPDWYVGSAVFPVVFGAYRLLREVGSGGMARVYLAEPAAGSPAVALKIPILPHGQDAKALRERTSRRERFLREARVTQQLDHPRLCRALDVGECAGLPYFTMPYYPHGSIAEELRSCVHFAQDEAARLVADVAQALQHAHCKGFVHRDLKPSNLLRDDQERVVVTDFGLALSLEQDGPRLTSTDQVPGTPLYFSPEQAAGARDLTPASDVFSLGVVLYELLAGKRPFAGNLLEVLQAIAAAAPPPLEQHRPDIAPALAATCRRAMARDPGDRYPSMAAFADDLERSLTSIGARATRAQIPKTTTHPSVRLRRWRRRWKAGLAVGGTVLLAGLTLWAIVGGYGPPPRQASGEGDPRSVEHRAIVSTRQPLGLRRHWQLLHDDLLRLGAAVQEHVRYFSLLAVHDNPYISDEDYKRHRDALGRVLNRLSRDKPEVAISSVDPSACLLRIDLRDLDWQPTGQWALLLRAEPYGVRYDDDFNPDETLSKIYHESWVLVRFDVPCVRADWFLAAITQGPLFDQLQKREGNERRPPPFDLTDSNDPLAQAVRKYQANAVDGRVAAAELGLGTVAELDARWPKNQSELRKELDRSVLRDRWVGDDRNSVFRDCVRALKLGAARAPQPLR